jgi:hypothetical protein
VWYSDVVQGAGLCFRLDTGVNNSVSVGKACKSSSFVFNERLMKEKG